MKTGPRYQSQRWTRLCDSVYLKPLQFDYEDGRNEMPRRPNEATSQRARRPIPVNHSQ